MEFKVGMFPEITRAEYDSVVALNQSSIKLIDERHVRAAWRRLHHPDPPSEAMIKGSAFHCLLLEPRLFDERYVVRPKWDMRTKVGKADRELWEAENVGWELKYEIPEEDFAEMQVQVAAMKAHPTVGRLIEGAVYCECAIFWEHPQYGFFCKALVDGVSRVDGRTIVWDPKTTRDATASFWRKEINNRNYMVQAEWTLQGFNELAPADRDFFFVPIELGGDMDIMIYECGPLTRFEAKHRIEKACQKWAKALATGTYPGAATGVQMIEAPKWAMTHERDFEIGGGDDDGG